MNINATLLVQIFHFIIAYILLKKLLFAPVFSIIMQRHHYTERLKRRIDAEEHTIAKLKEQQKEQWFAFQNAFAALTPTKECYSVAVDVPQEVPTAPPFSDQELQKGLSAMAQAMVKGVAHE